MEKLIIFSAPSGSGKTTVVKHLLKTFDKLAFSVSATTRKQRPNEVHGKDYYFFSEEEFMQKVEAGEFLEHEEVYKGLHYGTLKSEVQRLWDENKAVIFDVDVQGGIRIKEYYQDKALSVFLKPPSVKVLLERLKNRDTEVEHQLKERVNKAKEELEYAHQFDVTIVNDRLNITFAEAENLVASFLESTI